MPIKAENQFISGVHKYLPASVYHMKNNNPYIGGVPDVWYSGPAGDLWVEYKFLPRVPQRGTVKAAITPLQQQWIDGRYQEGRNVVVILGCRLGGVILQDLAWNCSINGNEYTEQVLSRKHLAERITKICTER